MNGDEDSRLAALIELDVLDTPPEAEFDGLVKVAASVCDTPISLITMIDHDRQWFKASVGLDALLETPREVAFCAHTIHDDEIFEITDASLDPRFIDNPLVTGHPNIRFYAGFTLRLSNGARVGTLCVIDQQPRQLTPQQREILRHLSTAVVQALESRRVTRNLATSEARFRALSAAAPLGIFRADADGACTYANERWQAIFNLSQSEVLGRGWCKLFHPEDKKAVFTEWTDKATLRREFDMEFRIIHTDGRVVNIRAITRPVITQDGKVAGHVGSVEDVTDRFLVQRTLFEERRRLKSIIEGTGAGTWEWNIQSGEMHFNNRWAGMLGMTLDELKPSTIQTWYELAHPDDIISTDLLLDQHLSGEAGVYDCELRLRHREGHWVWVQTRGRVLTHGPDGRPEWMFGTQLDITMRKEQEQALRKSERLLAETGALADVGGWELDLTTEMVRWTDQTCRIHGLPPGYQPRLDESIDFYEPEARPVIKDVIDRAIRDGQAWDIELPLVQINGNSIWVRSVGHVEYSRNVPVRLVGTVQNVTERLMQRQALEHAHERINVATESGNIGVWDWDIQKERLEWTPQMFALYGLPLNSKHASYEHWVKHIHPEDRVSTEQILRKAIEAINATDKIDLEFRTLWPDQSVHYMRASANITRNTDGTAIRMLGVNWDVTPLSMLSIELAEQHELLHVTLQSIGDAVITSDSNGLITWLNPAAEHMTGWLSGDARGMQLNQVFNIVDEETRQPAKDPVHACLNKDSVVGQVSKTVLISRSGAEFGIEDTAAPIRSKSGDLLGVVLVFHDVTEQRRLTSEMSYRAKHDSLTGLVNRSEFESRLQNTLNKAIDQGSEHALMYIDLDQFKLVNDACGHSEGDQLLVQIAKLLDQTVRRCDTLGRLGGDEFGVILENCTSVHAHKVAQQICDSMDRFRFEHEKRRFRIGTSIGLVTLDSRWTNIESAMKAADTSCYAAKEAGRNRVHVWFDTDVVTRTRRKDMKWTARLEQALDEKKFVLYAQRIESVIASSSAIRAEVLIRMRDDDGSLILPNAFLPAAERFNLATRIDRWVLENALNVLVQLPDITAIETLCINLSGQSVSDRIFHNDAVHLLTQAGGDICQRVCLEITETAAVTNITDATIFIEQVRSLGVKIALDDFGSGASSFGYLKTLPVDVLKIDGQFIKGMINDPLDAAAVRCFVDIARVMNLKTIAEYVNSKAVLDCLGAIGIDFAQGSFLHEAEPIEIVCTSSNIASSETVDKPA